MKILLNKEQLRQLQMIELEMLLEVDRICKKYNIQYNIIGGTLLGAVRHGGFIPWDDDADITMFRTEYNKFKKVCAIELDHSRFYFQDADETEGYRWSYGKLRRKNTLFLREHQEHMPYEQGVFIDIFPVDGVPDNYILRALNGFHCWCIRKILWSEVGRIADKNVVRRFIYKGLSKIPREKVIKHYNRIVKKRNQRVTKRVRIALMPVPNQGFGYLREWFVNSGDYGFEGRILKGIADYQNFLSFEFGNYMELPPEEKRKLHPVSSIKLIDNSTYL